MQRKGFDLIYFRSLNTILTHHRVNVVLDVGANTGQYGHKLRELGYGGRIISFEPQKRPFAELSAAAGRDGNWTAVSIGLGNQEGQKSINVYDDTCLSSMLTLDEKTYFYGAKQVGAETIEIRTLDGVIDQYTKASDRILLKIDTQGFEKPVLAGAEQSFARLVGIQLELSLTPIYADQPHLDEMIAFLREKGFILWQIQRGICNLKTGQELEADGIFIHRRYANA